MVVIGLVVAAMANLIVTVIPDNRNSTGLELCVNIVSTATSRTIISSTFFFFSDSFLKFCIRF